MTVTLEVLTNPIGGGISHLREALEKFRAERKLRRSLKGKIPFYRNRLSQEEALKIISSNHEGNPEEIFECLTTGRGMKCGNFLHEENYFSLEKKGEKYFVVDQSYGGIFY